MTAEQMQQWILIKRDAVGLLSNTLLLYKCSLLVFKALQSQQEKDPEHF